MNILFFTLIDFDSIKEHGIYQDLLREFTNNNHRVYIISPVERRKNKHTYLIEEENVVILKLRIGNIQKTKLIEKGISTILIESKFINAIKRYFSDVNFDLVLYSTPPITFCNAIMFVKKRDGAKTYLLLKDIFPQNAVDMGMIKCSGVRGILYKFFRDKERKLYAVSDYIGCMSQANVNYVLQHNPEIDSKVVEVCPNCMEVIDKSINKEERINIRTKYGVPLDKTVFIYGGNLGKPQGINFLIKCLYSQRRNLKVFFLIVGNGTEYKKLEEFSKWYPQENLKVMNWLPKEDYDIIVGACDVGMIFLDHRFTIPNFPSRILSYMQAKIPVLACTDKNTDVGTVITDGGFGWWCESKYVNEFVETINHIIGQNLKYYGMNGYNYMKKYYGNKVCYEIIISHMNSDIGN